MDNSFTDSKLYAILGRLLKVLPYMIGVIIISDAVGSTSPMIFITILIHFIAFFISIAPSYCLEKIYRSNESSKTFLWAIFFSSTSLSLIVIFNSALGLLTSALKRME